MDFFLGTHCTEWLERVEIPLFVAAQRLRRRRQPRAVGRWALDSGGFSAIKADGCYLVGPRQYAAEVRRWRDEVGGPLQWAAIQDWMCEPEILNRTAKTVGQHQQLTVNSWVALNSIDAALPWVPVLQGFTVDDYHRCVDLYETHAGTDLTGLPLVGLGSVCRRQGTTEAAAIVCSLYARGLHNLHGFGFKTLGLTGKRSVASYLRSSDSLAWSRRARNAWDHDRERLCKGRHRGGCGNCQAWALTWRERLVRRIERATVFGTQLLFY